MSKYHLVDLNARIRTQLKGD